jgi:hypothetical protein
VAKLAPGGAIKVTLKGGQPISRYFVGANESELIVLNLTDATLPRQVTRPLRNLASDDPFELVRVSHGETLTKEHLRVGPDGLFLDGRKVAAVEQVVAVVARSNIAEISRVHRATKRGFGWGALVGLGLGLAATLGACGTDWSQETSSCSNLTPIWVFIGPLYGTLIGGAVGATTTISTVVYRARP